LQKPKAVDVARSASLAKFRAGRNRWPKWSIRLAEKHGKLAFCYEAGPCGYGLHRQVTILGHDCVVVAPSLVPTRPGDNVKTDRRDAKTLAALFRSGELTPVWVPDEMGLGHYRLRFNHLAEARGMTPLSLFQKPRPHPEEPQSGVSKDDFSALWDTLDLRNDLSGLLRMKADGGDLELGAKGEELHPPPTAEQ
jgi:hypothetical protein